MKELLENTRKNFCTRPKDKNVVERSMKVPAGHKKRKKNIHKRRRKKEIRSEREKRLPLNIFRNKNL